MVAMTRMGDLLGPEPVLLPGDAEAEAELLAGEKAAIVAAAHPSASVAWAALAEQALDDDKAVTAYAYARTGYHRGLDQLRRNGWKGFGPVRSRTSRTRGSCAVSPHWRGPPTRSARPTNSSAASICSTTVTRPPATNSGWRVERYRRAVATLTTRASQLAVAATSGRLDLNRGVRQAAGGQHRAGLVEHTRAVGGARQVRGGHVLAGDQGPHVQIVHVGDAVDGAQRLPQLLDVDVAR